ncbi:MAG: VWA domain-containing protein [Syntrophobacteraceae bacterium]
MEEVLEEFVLALRSSGVLISVAECIDAMRAVDLVGYADRQLLREALSGVLAKSSDEKQVFTITFERFFSSEGFPDPCQGIEDTSIRVDLRASDSTLTRLLVSGTPADLVMSVREGARAVDVATIGFFFQGPYIRRILHQMGLEGLNHDIEMAHGEDGAASQRRAMILELARSRLIENVKSFAGRQYTLFAGSSTEGAIEKYLRNARLSELEERDLKRIYAIIQKMLKHLNALYARRRKTSKRGQLDFKRTFRANIAFDGLMFDRMWKAKKIDRPDIIVLCDVSRSVRAVVRFLLLFLYGLNQTLVKIRSFVFCSNLVEVSDIFDRCLVEEALARILTGAETGLLMGRTDYGEVFREFGEKWLDTVTSKTTVIILGDGRNNYGDPQTEILKAIYRRCRRLIWLNPESRPLWGAGDSEMNRYLPFCHLAKECNTVRHLERVVHALLRHHSSLSSSSG